MMMFYVGSLGCNALQIVHGNPEGPESQITSVATNNLQPLYVQTYRVKEGEGLYDVAIRFGVNPSDQKTWNSLDTTKLKAGKILKISNEIGKGNPSWAVPADVAEENIPPASSKTYVVKEGEDLYGVAIRWGVSPGDLKMLNNLITPNLKAGQILKLPHGYVEDGK